MPCYFFTNTCRDKPDLQLGDKSYKVIFNASAFENEKNLEKKSILEYIIDKKSTSEFTTKIDTLVEQTKLNEIFKGDYMAWGLAEFDAEQRGKKEGYSAGVSDGIQQGLQQGISQGIQQGEYKAKIETAKNLLAMGLSIENICKATDLSIEEVNLISNNTK